MRITWDTVEGGAGAEYGGGTVSVTRTGLVEDIDAAAMSDPYVLIRALEGVLAESPRTHPGLSYALLRNIIIKPVRSTNQAAFTVTYEGPTPESSGGGNKVRWVVEDDTTLTSEVETFDFEGEFLHVKYTYGQGGVVVSASEENFAAHPFDANVLRPRRRISIHGYIIGRPSEEVLDAVGTVNSKAFFGKKKGYWLCTNAGARVEHNAPTALGQTDTQLYRVSAAWLTKVHRDWSHYAYFKDITGRVPKELLTKEARKIIKENIETDYEPFLRKNTPSGFARVGMYKTADMGKLFGLDATLQRAATGGFRQGPLQ